MNASALHSHGGRIAVLVLCAALAALSLTAGSCADPKQQSYSQDQDIDAKWLAGANTPPSPRTLHAMARILASQGRDAEAAAVLTKILRDHPDFLPAYVEMAEVHMRGRRVESAMHVLHKGLKLAPKDAVLLNDLGMCWLIKKDYPKASASFSQAAAAQPGDVRYRANMALALGMSGRYDEALSLYKQVLDEADAHENLAVICLARKDTDRAAKEQAEAQRLRILAAEAAKGKKAPETQPAQAPKK